MGKKAKEHRKRVAKRNERIAQERKKAEKAQMEFLMNLINKEKAAGAFNSPVMPMPTGFEVPIMPLSGFEGPMLSTPIMTESSPTVPITGLGDSGQPQI